MLPYLASRFYRQGFFSSFCLFVWISNISANYYFSLIFGAVSVRCYCSLLEMWTCMLMSYMLSVMLKSFFSFQSLNIYTLLWLQLSSNIAPNFKVFSNFLFYERIVTWSQLDGKMCRSWLKVDPIHIRWFCCRKILKVRTTELLFFSVSLDFH